MRDGNLSDLEMRVAQDSRSALDEILRAGAQRVLAVALEAELDDCIERFKALRDADGLRLVTRNGHLPKRDLQSPLGPIEIEQPRVRDRREGQRFTSGILPPYLRRSPSMGALIP